MTADLLSIPQVCIEANTGRTTIYKLINSGQLPAVKLGKKTLVRRDDLKNFMGNLSAYVPSKIIKAGETK
jgi:excisionase family DNA binding protein